MTFTGTTGNEAGTDGTGAGQGTGWWPRCPRQAPHGGGTVGPLVPSLPFVTGHLESPPGQVLTEHQFPGAVLLAQSRVSAVWVPLP